MKKSVLSFLLRAFFGEKKNLELVSNAFFINIEKKEKKTYRRKKF